MRNKIKLVVFDMAGTTINEDNIVYKTILAALIEHNINTDLETVLEHCAGKEKRTAIKDLLLFMELEASKQFITTIFETFKERLTVAYDNLEVTSFAGVEAVFEMLRKKEIKVALNTGYDFKTASKLLNNLNWTEGVQYDTLITADDVVNGRPNPDMIYKAMDRLGVESAAEVAKIGDSIVDIMEGQSANCLYCIGITTGAQSRKLLAKANPTHIFDEISELMDFV